MTPKEEAKVLVDIFGVELALVCVDKLIECLNNSSKPPCGIKKAVNELCKIVHYRKVKQEIEKL